MQVKTDAILTLVTIILMCYNEAIGESINEQGDDFALAHKTPPQVEAAEKTNAGDKLQEDSLDVRSIRAEQGQEGSTNVNSYLVLPIEELLRLRRRSLNTVSKNSEDLSQTMTNGTNRSSLPTEMIQIRELSEQQSKDDRSVTHSDQSIDKDTAEEFPNKGTPSTRHRRSDDYDSELIKNLWEIPTKQEVNDGVRSITITQVTTPTMKRKKSLKYDDVDPPEIEKLHFPDEVSSKNKLKISELNTPQRRKYFVLQSNNKVSAPSSPSSKTPVNVTLTISRLIPAPDVSSANILSSHSISKDGNVTFNFQLNFGDPPCNLKCPTPSPDVNCGSPTTCEPSRNADQDPNKTKVNAVTAFLISLLQKNEQLPAPVSPSKPDLAAILRNIDSLKTTSVPAPTSKPNPIFSIHIPPKSVASFDLQTLKKIHQWLKSRNILDTNPLEENLSHLPPMTRSERQLPLSRNDKVIGQAINLIEKIMENQNKS